MSDYKPGTVAIATVRGVEGVRIYRASAFWYDTDGGTIHHSRRDLIADVRPLVVLDLGENPSWFVLALKRVEEASHGHRSAAGPIDRNRLMNLADQIEAQIKRPRIPEPGQWAVVEALIGGEVFTFVNRGSGWVCVDDGALWEWDRLIDPVLVRDGVLS